METLREVMRGTGVAVWKQIQRVLEDEISSGKFKPGGRCPTEHALAARFGVNRHTVRRSLQALQDKGLVRIEQGRGTFVREAVIDYPLRKRTRFREAIGEQSRVASGRLVSSETKVADAAIAYSLGIEPGDSVLMLRVLREADDRPISISDHLFPASRFPNMIEAFQEHGSITAAFSAHGVIDYTRRVTRVGARLPEREEAEILDQPATRPVLVTESINVDLDGRPIEFGISRFAGDRVQLVIES